MRRRAKVDANQKEIVELLRSMGCSVCLLHTVGAGVPDLLVGLTSFKGNKINILMEIKDGDKKRLTPDQIQFHEDWKGIICVAHSVKKAEDIIDYYRRQ